MCEGVCACNFSIFVSTYPQALIHSLLYSATKPATFAKRHRQQGKLLKASFLSVPYGRGSTTSVGDCTTRSFGLPISFFRVRFTSAFKIPYCRVHWVNFHCTSASDYCYIGSMSRDEWVHGPQKRDGHTTVQKMYDVASTRYVLAYDKLGAGDDFVKCSFLSLDPDRINLSDLPFKDLGDNCILGNTTDRNGDKRISEAVMNFLKMAL